MNEKIENAYKNTTYNKFTFKNGYACKGYILTVEKEQDSNILKIYISPREDPPIYYLEGWIVKSDFIVDMQEIDED